MATNVVEPLEIDSSLVGGLEVGAYEVPYVDLNDEPIIHTHVRLGDTEYVYQRSFPIRGHGAIMPAALDELQAQARPALVVERDDRYLLYAT